MHNKPAISSVPIHDILQNRWSPRSFDADKSIDPQTLTALLEAARWAPSCFNDQPWRFLVCNKTTHLSAWEKLLSTLGEKNQIWARNAPVLILSMAMHEFGHNGKPNRWSMYDAGAASVSLCLQATSMGLATHQMGGFDAAQCKQSFDLPDACNPMSVIAVGHRAAAELLPDDLRETELKARSRKPLNECFYFGSFNA